MPDNARLEVTVDRKRERTRDRGSGHNEQVGTGPFGAQKITLPHTKTMLLVNHHKRKMRKDNVIPQHSMGSKEDVELAAAKGKQDTVALCSRCRSGKQRAAHASLLENGHA